MLNHLEETTWNYIDILFHSEMAQVVQILAHGKQRPVYPSYHYIAMANN